MNLLNLIKTWTADTSNSVWLTESISEQAEVEESESWELKEGELVEREFSSDERERLSKSGAAMSGGGYPIVSVGDLRNAIQAIGRAKNPSATRSHIRRRARALGKSDLIPDSWGESEEELEEAKPMGLTEPLELVEEQDGGTVEVTIIRSGWSQNNRYYSPAVLAQALPLFEGAQAFVDHQASGRERMNRSVRDLVGVFEGVYQDARGSLRAKLRLIGKLGEEVRPYIKEAISGTVKVGLSINAGGNVKPGIAEGRSGLIVEALTKVDSVDVVLNPAAGGRFERLVASDWLAELLKEVSFEEWKENHPEHKGEESMPDLKEQIEEAVKAAVSAAVEPLHERLESASRRDMARVKLAASPLPTAIHSDLLEALELLDEEGQDKEIARQVEILRKMNVRPVVTGAGQGGSNPNEKPLTEEVGSKVLGINVPYAKPEETVWEYRERTRRQTA